MQKQYIRTPRPKQLLCQGKDLSYIYFMPKFSFSQINFHKKQVYKSALGNISELRFKKKEFVDNLDLSANTLGLAKSIHNARKLIISKKISVNNHIRRFNSISIKIGSSLTTKK